ncbi:TetR family transcriptional regulator [Rhodococcus sp. KBW08]|uniref:TetR/AcrR family transcriptional regulator n=1 Tax=Rhodococcus TaxID=1827 RepID=UPI000F59F2A1|nr:TetR/AcrR family transcriptional regulator [Rhodococcus sp. KBW08]MDJ0105275.1 TetR/AcrR family transcriptional regulator [Rhodococcus erythropolis]RQO46840.1 TetR family transcriptional regulator [Rhodococcus sp. KBW08]
MRPSNRTTILDAAIRVIQRDGVTAVTFDSVAAESGLTRGGLLYHFPSRDDLLSAIHQYMADQWEDSLIAAAGKPAADATPVECLSTYVRVCSQSATRAELQLMLEAATTPASKGPWNSVLQRWAPPPADDTPEEMARFIARLAADGLWMYEAMCNQPLDPELRRIVTEHIADGIP